MRVRDDNDAFRRGMCVTLNAENAAVPAGKYVMSAGVHNLPFELQMLVIEAVRNDDNFTEDTDPYGEHEFGVIEVSGLPRIYWRIGYYADAELAAGADPDAGDVFRLLTVYLADEH